jgi:Tfp pilus assembly protein PilF
MRFRSPDLRAAVPRALLGSALGTFALSGAFSGSVIACATQNPQTGVHSPERQSDAEYDIARDLFGKGNTREALDHANKAVALNEENAKAHYMRAGILTAFCTGPRGFDAPDCNLGEIEKSARAALKVDPDFRDARNMLGQMLINEKKYKEAIAVLEPLTKDPAYVYPHLAWGNYGWAQVLDGQVDAGIASLRNAVTEPRFCVGLYHLGVALEKKGDPAMAEQSLTSAVSAPDVQCANLQDAYEARGRVRVKLGKMPEARQDYERCVEISKETNTGKVCASELKRMPQMSASPSSYGGGASPEGEVNPNETRTL